VPRYFSRIRTAKLCCILAAEVTLVRFGGLYEKPHPQTYQKDSALTVVACLPSPGERWKANKRKGSPSKKEMPMEHDNEREPDYSDLKLGWGAISFLVVGTAIIIATYIAFGPG
jgi:hypothetical protein